MSDLSGYRLLSELAYAPEIETSYKGLYRKGPKFHYPYPKGPLGEALKCYDDLVDENEVLQDLTIAREIRQQFLRVGFNYDLVFFSKTEKEKPHIIRQPPDPGKSLGYDICWPGGSFYSIVYDELVYGLKQGKANDSWLKVLDTFSADLNNNLLFSDWMRTSAFLEEYMKAPYPEREEGPFYIWMLWQL
jgi:hypothetical protein